MKNKWLIIAVLLPMLSHPQDSRSKGKIQAITSVGFAAGESTAKPLFQLSGGLSFGRLFGGIGLGLDDYNHLSFPLFADWRWNFGRNEPAFIYFHGGYNFAAQEETSVGWAETTDRLYGGFYMDAGVGYRVHLSSSHRLLFSGGFSQKNIRHKLGYSYCGFTGSCPEQVYNYNYKFGRIVAKVSWEFGAKR